MARSVVARFASAAMRGDFGELHVLLPQLAVAARLGRRITEARELEALAEMNRLFEVPERLRPYFRLTIPRCTVDDLLYRENITAAFWRIVREHQGVERLAAVGSVPTHSILLTGDSGNGKTSFAHALAAALELPLFIVQQTLIDSYLGETVKHLAQIFDAIRDQRCIVFFDEFDAFVIERDSEIRTGSGEMARACCYLLNALDTINYPTVVIAATNHGSLIDRAAWRRFDLQLTMNGPSEGLLTRWIDRFADKLDHCFGYSLEPDNRRDLGRLLAKLPSYAELNLFCDSVIRALALAGDAKYWEIIEDAIDTAMLRGSEGTKSAPEQLGSFCGGA